MGDERKVSGEFRKLNVISFGGLTRLKSQDTPYVEMWAEVHWTDDAAEYIRNEEYAYISPEFDLDYMDPKSGNRVGAALLAIGLTNRPFLKGMARVTVGNENKSTIQVMATGEWYHQFYGRITIEEKHLDEMIANMSVIYNTMSDGAENPPTEMMVDYNHMSLFGGPEEAKAAGWVRGKGIYKEKSAGRAAAVEPAPSQRIAASDAAGRRSFQPNVGAKTMNDKRVRELLKLAEEAEVTDEHRSQAFDLLDQAAGNVRMSEGELAALKLKADAGEQAALALKKRDADDAVKAALEAHKITAAQVDWATGYALNDLAGFQKFVEGQPVLVPSGRQGSNDTNAQGASSRHQVKQWIDTKVAEGMAVDKAVKLAEGQFDAETFKAWRFPNKKN